MSTSPKKKAKRRGDGDGEDTDDSNGHLERVFQPKDDLDNLDEADRDVELFKKCGLVAPFM